jgi:hypothetical protein
VQAARRPRNGLRSADTAAAESSCRAHLIGQRRDAQLKAFAGSLGEAAALALYLSVIR